MSDLFFWVIAAIVLGLGIYSNYTNWKLLLASNKAKEQFEKNHKNVQCVQTAKWRAPFFSVLAIACFAFSVVVLYISDASLTQSSRISQAALYAALGVFSVALVPEAVMDSKILYTPEGFIYETDYVRFKSILKVDYSKNFFRASTMTLSTGKEIMLAKPVGKWLSEQYALFKAQKAEARKTRRRR